MSRRRYLTTGQVAKALGITDRAVRKRAEAGTIPAVRLGDEGHWRIPREWLEDLMASVRPVLRRATATVTTALFGK